MDEPHPAFQVISQWFRRNFSNPDALALVFTFLLAFLLFKFLGEYLIPVLISIVIAYLLTFPVRVLKRWRFPRLLSVIIVYLLFLGVFLAAIFGVIPLMSKQLMSLVREIPHAIGKTQLWLLDMAHRYPKIFPADPLNSTVVYLKDRSAHIGQLALSFSLATIPGIIQTLLYLVLVPLMVFFFLKDGKQITQWLSRFLPKRRSLLLRIWSQLRVSMGAYVRGRFTEIVIVSVISVIVFESLGLNYAVLLGVLLGVSVIIPYIGAIIITIPITIVGLMQWGWSAHFAYLLLIYAIIITVDGNILVPLLFSGAMDLHPVVIILSVLIFGGIWGFWGVFFAIPLATVLKTILYEWPQVKNLPQPFKSDNIVK